MLMYQPAPQYELSMSGLDHIVYLLQVLGDAGGAETLL